MKARQFIISLEEANLEAEKNLWTSLSLIGGITWWHWLPTTWLIVDQNNVLNVNDLRNIVIEHFPTQNFIITEVNAITWAGRGRKIKNKSMFEWLNKFWTNRSNQNEINII